MTSPEVRKGPIPASAGEPVSHRYPLRSIRAYPRECGGAQEMFSRAVPEKGLSPRVRGSPSRKKCDVLRVWPIPASAGEPENTWASSTFDWAYPRECGGAPNACCTRKAILGLSPRVRGSRFGVKSAFAKYGPIPASAGEPEAVKCGGRLDRAYPRECGGAGPSPHILTPPPGLSPRVRGSRFERHQLNALFGPIPASAGEPPIDARRAASTRAYPRECGGAQRSVLHEPRAMGLSPRVRGSRQLSSTLTTSQGPIPASAGEPSAHRQPLLPCRAYPRECGGAVRQGGNWSRLWGLSPRVRGSLHVGAWHARFRGPIPASAGEPLGVKPMTSKGNH